MTILASFRWQRCFDGYEIAEERLTFEAGVLGPSTDPVIKPRTDRMETFRPFEIHGVLFRRFAALDSSASDTSVEEILGFAQCYGLLTDPREAERPAVWTSGIDTMQAAIRMWDEGYQEEVVHAFNDLKLGRVDVRLVRIPGADRPQVEFDPRSLLNAMLLQFAFAVSGRERHKACLWCKTWFAHGPGTGRRETAIYCSAKCQKAYQYAKRKEVKNERPHPPPRPEQMGH